MDPARHRSQRLSRGTGVLEPCRERGCVRQSALSGGGRDVGHCDSSDGTWKASGAQPWARDGAVPRRSLPEGRYRDRRRRHVGSFPDLDGEPSRRRARDRTQRGRAHRAASFSRTRRGSLLGCIKLVRLNLLRRYSLLAALCCVICDGAAYTTEYHVKIAMRDGVRLEANLYRPETGSRWPVLLVRTPYNKGIALFPGYQVFIEHGYAILIEDVRGKYGSEGHFSSLDQEGVDGYDTINWIARQQWSDGNVGMVGGSYLGIAQWKAAVLNNPHLKAIAPAVSGDDDYFDRFYSPGGAYRLGHRLLWFSENLRLPGFAPNFDSYVRHLPLRTADRAATGQTLRDYQETLDHPLYDEFWKRMSVRMKLGRVRVPVFSVGGWYDGFVESDLDAFRELRRHGVPAEIVIGPWPHNASIRFLGVDYGP